MEGRSFTYLARFVGLDGKDWIEPMRRQGTKGVLEQFAGKFLRVEVMDPLPAEPDHVLLRYSDPLRGTADVYKVNVRTGAGERFARAGEDESYIGITDREGRLRAKSSARFEGGDWVVHYEIFDPASGNWEDQPALSYPVKSRRNVDIIGFDPELPDILLIKDNSGSDLAAIKGYDVKKKAFVEVLFQHPKFEATGVRLAREGGKGIPKSIAGFTYDGASEEVYWIDPYWKSIQDGLKSQFPNDNINILNLRRDLSFKLIEVSSSRHPPSYYLLKNDQELIKLGDSRPEINPADLEPTKLVYYKARDGLEIPALLTLPKGFRPGTSTPVPAVIMPHGGPWARDNADWDPAGWTQFLASRGYAVLQPQYRGSQGWGDKLWKAGDEQWGLKMQDDKDDGAQWLVAQGIADSKRMAIFGYSYGGFAAMTAATRPNSPYRCAIAGAGVSNLSRIQNSWGENRIQRQLQGWTVKGTDAMSNVDKANIPILIYHGDRDQTVPIVHARELVAALRSRGKAVTYFEVEDMPHSLPWWPAWQEKTLTAIEAFLAKDCGFAKS